MDVFHMSRAQFAGVAIGTLYLVPKAHPNSSTSNAMFNPDELNLRSLGQFHAESVTPVSWG
jgi:hypothetical protein